MRALAFAFLLFAQSLFAQYTGKDYSHLIGMPGFTEPLLRLHFKLYEGYVKNANDLLSKLETLDSASYEFGALKRRFGWEFDGMRLHELYFGNLGGSGTPDRKHPLFAALAAQFGNFEKWKKDFVATGSMRGIGWAILYLDPAQKRLINAWINEHDLGHLAGGAPLLVMDVFEHAYMPQFGLDRAGYIEAFFKNVNWKAAENRYSEAVPK